VVSASSVALAHGANDAQKTTGVITLALITSGALAPGSGPLLWVILAAAVAIASGTYMGGWRIIRTLGRRISHIETPQGFTAETTSATIILFSTYLGLPLSTTQVCTGAIFGAGAGARRRMTPVRCSLAGRMATAWASTLPAAGVVGPPRPGSLLAAPPA
jgi:inorganic phosphate transporter, PiT family